MPKDERDRSGHKMISMKPELWRKVDEMARADGLSRSAVIALAVGAMWRAREGREAGRRPPVPAA